MDSTERYAEQLDDDLHYRNNSGPNNVLVSSTLNAKNISMLFPSMEAIAISSYSLDIAKSIKDNYLSKKIDMLTIFVKIFMFLIDIRYVPRLNTGNTCHYNVAYHRGSKN
uniref:Uncharacterized protein n=1 Tax=Vespula pensylvanica TaxID=30213 RepID=A0A834PEJ8_VESPE|nr:hypothetical protein H0235_000827 [Vespula pensylvanica]